MSNTDKQPRSGEITTEQALELCREIYPNLTWKIATQYDPRYSHGKIYGSMDQCFQFIDLTILIGGHAIASLYLGKAGDYSGQVMISRGEPFQLGKVDPGYDLGSYLRGFQKQLLTQARLSLIFASYTRSPHSVILDSFGQPVNVLWQYDSTLSLDEGMIAPIPQEDLECPFCGHPHTDFNEWAIKPHQTHLCHNCAEEFEGTQKAVSRPTFTQGHEQPENVTYEPIKRPVNPD